MSWLLLIIVALINAGLILAFYWLDPTDNSYMDETVFDVDHFIGKIEARQ